MEASAAGLAPAAGDAPAEGQAPAGGEQDAQQQPDLGQLSSTLDGIGQMLEQQRDYLASEPWQQRPAEGEVEGEPQPAAPDLSFLDENQPGFTPEAAAQQLAALIDNAAQERATSAVAPLAQQLQDMQVTAESDAMIARYPQMGEDEVAEKVIDTAQKWCESIGRPELAAEPAVWEMVYLAGRAADQANAEGQGGPAATLEGAGGASPGGAAQGEIPTTQSITAGWQTNRLPMFGGQAR